MQFYSSWNRSLLLSPPLAKVGVKKSKFKRDKTQPKKKGRLEKL
jgi:hypothetical protein